MCDIKDDYLSGKALAELLGVSTMTIFRWEGNPRLNFHSPSRVHGRKFWHRPVIVEWMKARAVQRTPGARSLAMSNALEDNAQR